MIKRYLLFAHDVYYPRGGMRDHRFSFDNYPEFVSHFERLNHYDSYQIYDTEEGRLYLHDSYNDTHPKKEARAWAYGITG